MDDRSGTRAVRELLRQLTSGLAVHRLYPADPMASSFVAACERIGVAAQAALVAGAVHVEVRSDGFRTSEGPIGEPMTARLAQACFERRVEYLEFTAAPTRKDLAAWYELLTRDVAQIARSEGVPALLRAAGVSSIVVAAGVPEPAAGEETPEHLMGLADWVSAVDETTTAEEVAALTLLAGEGGAGLYRRLLDFSRTVPADGTIRSTFFRRAAGLVEQLPTGDQAVFCRLMIDGLATEPFAERYAGHLTDLALATSLLIVSDHEGSDPVQLARDVGLSARRHTTLVRLVESLRAAPQAHPGPAQDRPARADPTAVQNGAGEAVPAIGDLLASFPDDAVSGRRLALTALLDVLVAAPRDEQLAALAANLTEHLRQAVRNGDTGAVEDLAALIERVEELAPDAVTITGLLPTRHGAPSSVAQTLIRARDEALSAELIHEAAVASSRRGQRLAPGLFAPFGSAAIASLLGALASADGSPVEAQILPLIDAVSEQDRWKLYEQLGRQPPEVLVRLVPLLAQRPDPRLVSVLEQLARRPNEHVRSAVVSALERSTPAEVAGVAATVIEHSSLLDLRRRCLDVIEAAGDVGRPHLERLAAGTGRRLPWRLRRRVRGLLQRGRGA